MRNKQYPISTQIRGWQLSTTTHPGGWQLPTTTHPEGWQLPTTTLLGDYNSPLQLIRVMTSPQYNSHVGWQLFTTIQLWDDNSPPWLTQRMTIPHNWPGGWQLPSTTRLGRLQLPLQLTWGKITPLHNSPGRMTTPHHNSPGRWNSPPQLTQGDANSPIQLTQRDDNSPPQLTWKNVNSSVQLTPRDDNFPPQITWGKTTPNHNSSRRELPTTTHQEGWHPRHHSCHKPSLRGWWASFCLQGTCPGDPHPSLWWPGPDPAGSWMAHPGLRWSGEEGLRGGAGSSLKGNREGVGGSVDISLVGGVLKMG